MTETFLYGSLAVDQYLIHNPESLPRYGHLARKVMIHYAGERYNPHRDGLWHEPFLRQMIKNMIAYKVFHRLTGYDWDFIDNMFRSYIAQCYKIDLPYNQERIDLGILPQFTAAVMPQPGSIH